MKEILKSDVFSFGILLWEIMSHSIAYSDIQDITQMEVLIREGKTPDVIDKRQFPLADSWVEEKILPIIQSCWHPDANKRPTFQELSRKISTCKEEKLNSQSKRKPTRNLISISARQAKAKEKEIFKVMENFHFDYQSLDVTPKEFIPRIENPQKASFSGGSGCVFSFVSIDDQLCVKKSRSFASNLNLDDPRVSLQNIFVLLPELEMMKLFRMSGYVIHCKYYDVADQHVNIYMDAFNLSLADEIQRRKLTGNHFSLDDCYSIALQLAFAIRDIHSEDEEDPIVHRDIKVNPFLFFSKFFDSSYNNYFVIFFIIACQCIYGFKKY